MPVELFAQYDPSLLAFEPAVPAPSSAPINMKKLNRDEFHSSELEDQVSQVLNFDHFKQWERSTSSVKHLKNGRQCS